MSQVGKAVRVVLGCLAVSVVTVGCATQPDLTKATFSRTTIPASTGTYTSGSAAAGSTAAFTLAGQRSVDPCGFLDKNTLGGLGSSTEPPTADGFDECDVDLTDSSGNDLDLSITIGEAISDKPATQIDGLPVAEQKLTDGSACFERIITASSPDTGIEVQADVKKDPCTPARQLAQSVITRLRGNPPKRSNLSGSLAALDPCTMVDDATAAAAVGANPDKTIDGLYKCDWQGEHTGLTVTFTSGEDPKADDAIATPQPVDLGGVTAYTVYSTDVFPSCEVKWMTRQTSDGNGEIVDVEFDNVDKVQVDTCAKAVAVAKVILPKVPKIS
ncbi:MAG TPA: hypothetical protein VHW44_25590 [Pseudonocardiaceae bacterium]|nr:hypothetical protein [Pseudonocardiaceae bacterium]